MSIKPQFLIERNGKQFALYAGLLDEAHEQGLKAITTTLIQIPNELNGYVAICHAVVETSKGAFTGLGDAAQDNVSRMMLPHLIRMAECVPLRAEILTRNGWATCEAVREGDEVLAYDITTDSCRWVVLQGKTIYREPREVIGLESRSFCAVVTPEHTWAVTNNGKASLRKTVDLTAADRIVVSAVAEGGDYPMAPREAAIIGWVLTDGTFRYDRGYPRIHIDQSKPHYVAELRALLGDDASEYVKAPTERTFPGGKTYQCRESHRFSLSAKATRELLRQFPLTEPATTALPRVVTRLSQPARAAMLDAMLKADGSGGDGRTWVFGKKRKPGVMEAFELLAILEGRALGRPRMSSGDVIPVRAMRENRHVSAGYLDRRYLPPEPVWCPTTPLGTWVMRLDGCVTITGNTRAKARALRDAVNVGVASAEELGPDGGTPDDDHGFPEPIERDTRRMAPEPDHFRETERTYTEPTGTRPGVAPATPKQLQTVQRMARALGKPVPSGNLSRAAASEFISAAIQEMDQRQAAQ